MRRTLWTLLPLWLGLPTPALCSSAPPACHQSEALDALTAEYERADAEWRERIRRAEDITERSELRAADPARAFYPRFRAAAEAGEGRAYLWMLAHVSDLDGKRAERKAERLRVFDRLFDDYLDEAWFDEALEALVDARRRLGDERVRRDLARAMGASASEDVRLAAQFRLGGLLLPSKDRKEHLRGVELLQRLLEEHPDSEYAESIDSRLFAQRYLTPGGEPLDFDATDVDGVAFSLSDYRGKVVLLDFWGFW